MKRAPAGPRKSAVVSDFVVPLVLHGFCAFLLMLEAEETWTMLIISIFPSFGAGMISEKLRRPFWAAAFAAAWIPAVMTATRWYWTLGMPSPGGAGTKLILSLTGIAVSPTAGVAAVMSAFGLAGWAFMRFDRLYEKKFGVSFFDED